MERHVDHIVVVGGGTAGWLAAALIAARAQGEAGPTLQVTVIEAPDVPTIGVGEGTWPTMRSTLAAIGIDEADFLRECDGAFKQGSRFDGWVSGEAGDSYLHPFTPPPAVAPAALVKLWSESGQPFADLMTAQTKICAAGLAPRQREMPPYNGALNYAYHLDAAKFAGMLSRHATQKLGVRHISDLVVEVEGGENDHIAAVHTRANGRIAGDLFIDCSGHAALLIGDHLKVPWIDRSDVVFNDRALAVQLPVDEASAIASQTVSTAHEGGWIWDIGLPRRRGIGCVYSSQFTEDARAEAILRDYLALAAGDAAQDLPLRQLRFAPGHRTEFWRGNCIALGMASGFIEPLEASAIVMIELGLGALLEDFPADAAAIAPRAARFNALFRYRWERIIEFLKLHYVLSRRSEPYWQAHQHRVNWPERLEDLLTLWRHRPPSVSDFPQSQEIFSAESHQYVLYGMGFAPPQDGQLPIGGLSAARQQLAQIAQKTRHFASALPDNRHYLSALQPTPPSQPAALQVTQ